MKQIKLITALVLSILPNPVKLPLYRVLFGARIGKHVSIGFGTVLLIGKLQLGDHTVIGYFNLIKAEEFVTGNYVRIGHLISVNVHRMELRSRAVISPRVDILGNQADPDSTIELGMHSWLFPYCVVNVNKPVVLGKNVGVGGGTYIFTHGQWLSQLDGFPVTYAPVEIGDDTWLAWGCFVMPGVRIGSRVVVGARAVVNKDVPNEALVGGVPAKLLKERSFRDVGFAEKVEMLADVTGQYGKRRHEAVDVCSQPDRTVITVGGNPLLVVHNQPCPPRESLDRGALNILPGALDRSLAEGFPCLALAGYASSSYDLMSDRIRGWLKFARVIGLRFYPVDER